MDKAQALDALQVSRRWIRELEDQIIDGDLDGTLEAADAALELVGTVKAEYALI